MKNLLSVTFFLTLLTVAVGQSSEIGISKFVCPPCGISCDKLFFKSEGKCHVCSMRLVKSENEAVGIGVSVKVVKTVFYYNSLKLIADIFEPDSSMDRKTGISIIQGSGSSGKSNIWSREIAGLLAEAGYTVLIPDKRGVGESDGDWRTSTFEELAMDARASVMHLKKIYNLKKMGIVGLSQGGRIAPIVASYEPSIDFVIDISGGTTKQEYSLIHEVINTSQQTGLGENSINKVLYLHALYLQFLHDNDWTPVESYLQTLEKSEWAGFFKTFPDSPNHWMWKFIKGTINYDPIPLWKSLDQDIFFAFGSADEDDNVAVYQSAYRIHRIYKSLESPPDYQVHIYPVGHSLRDVESEYNEIHVQFRQDLLQWLNLVASSK